MSPSGDSPNMLQLSVLISLMPQSKKKSVLKEHVGIPRKTVTTIQRQWIRGSLRVLGLYSRHPLSLNKQKGTYQRGIEWLLQSKERLRNNMGKHLADLISLRSWAGRPRMALAMFIFYVMNKPSRKPSAIYIFVSLFLSVSQSLSLCLSLPPLPSPLFETGFLCLAQSVLELSR